MNVPQDHLRVLATAAEGEDPPMRPRRATLKQTMRDRAKSVHRVNRCAAQSVHPPRAAAGLADWH